MLIMVGWLAVQTILYKTTPLLWISTDDLVEYKCPYSAQDTTVEEACTKKDFMARVKEGRVELKRTHKYYCRMLGQMAIH